MKKSLLLGTAALLVVFTGCNRSGVIDATSPAGPAAAGSAVHKSPAPARIGEADDAYVLQMALYWAVLRRLFPGHVVEAALVWTDGPKLMPVPEELMARALQTLALRVDS